MIAALHAEWTKLRTMGSSGWLLLALIVVTCVADAIVTDIVKCPASCSIDPAKVSLTGVMLGQAAVVALAVANAAGEYGSGMIRTTLTATPRRWLMVAAKATVLSAVITAAGIVAVLGSVLSGREFLPGNGYTPARGYPPLSLLDGSVLRAAAGSVLYLVLIGLIGLGAGLAFRSAAAATAVVLSVLYVFTYLGQLTPSATWQRRIERWTPMDAGLAIQATRDLASQAIRPWPGLEVCALWAAAVLLAGCMVLCWRDA
ncbi:MAG TPA: ABC transporter permease [Streptosporangiaceae bacterium]|nr:ABC transporter permease [Streptosporangiaceae bacterium]